MNIVPQPMFVLTYYEKHDDVKRQVNYYKFIETLNNQKVLPGRLIITNEEAPLTEEQATKHLHPLTNRLLPLWLIRMM